MTKSQLIESVVASTNHPRRAVEIAVNTVFDAMVDALQREERIEIRGFGNFVVRYYDAYTGRNPKTGQPVAVNAKRMPFFRVGKDLREKINARGK